MSSKIALGMRVALRRAGGRRSIATATLPRLEKKLMKVPTMGDSITEVRVFVCVCVCMHAVLVCTIADYGLLQY